MPKIARTSRILLRALAIGVAPLPGSLNDPYGRSDLKIVA